MTTGKILITGSGGLIGSAVARKFLSLGWTVVGIDNDSRSSYFGATSSVKASIETLCTLQRYEHINTDITHQQFVESLVASTKPDIIVHCAAQPSHDLAASMPLRDFDVNARSTLVLLDALYKLNKNAIFVLMSTNKVYGDAPNDIPVLELDTRYDYVPPYDHGVDENMRVDRSMHSLFGASKLAADVYTQEYGRYFGLNTVVLRAGCLTGPNHASAEAHGFLSYLIKSALSQREYVIHGYKGKQVRDQLHADDVSSLIYHVIENIASAKPGNVFNIGGCQNNSVSVLEAISFLKEIIGADVLSRYSAQTRKGDHLVYYSDMTKFKRTFPTWSMKYCLDDILREMVDIERVRS